MAIPKRKKPLADKERVVRAVNKASGNASQTESKQAIQQEKKMVGRPPLAGDRSARITFYLAQDTADQFELAFLSEKLKKAKEGVKVDKSLLIENILKEWMVKQ